MVAIREVPDVMKQAILAAEDERFYQHGGVDYLSVACKTSVLCGQNGLFHDIRDRLYRYDGVPFLAEFAERSPSAETNTQRDFRLVRR